MDLYQQEAGGYRAEAYSAEAYTAEAYNAGAYSGYSAGGDYSAGEFSTGVLDPNTGGVVVPQPLEVPVELSIERVGNLLILRL